MPPARVLLQHLKAKSESEAEKSGVKKETSLLGRSRLLTGLPTLPRLRRPLLAKAHRHRPVSIDRRLLPSLKPDRPRQCGRGLFL